MKKGLVFTLVFLAIGVDAFASSGRWTRNIFGADNPTIGLIGWDGSDARELFDALPVESSRIDYGPGGGSDGGGGSGYRKRIGFGLLECEFFNGDVECFAGNKILKNNLDFDGQAADALRTAVKTISKGGNSWIASDGKVRVDCTNASCTVTSIN